MQQSQHIHSSQHEEPIFLFSQKCVPVPAALSPTDLCPCADVVVWPVNVAPTVVILSLWSSVTQDSTMIQSGEVTVGSVNHAKNSELYRSGRNVPKNNLAILIVCALLNIMNKSLRVTEIPVQVTAKHPDPPHEVLPRHEFTMGLIAPKGQGKTTLICNLLRFYKQHFHAIYVFSPTVRNDDKWDW